MVCPHCQGAEDIFSRRRAQQDLDAYREKGASKATQVMLDMLKAFSVTGKTLLDIGGGVGAIQHELIASGLSHAIDVDASSAYINAASEEAQRQGHLEKIQFQHGDFVQIASEIEAADIVTLDKVLCCYPDVRALVDLSSQRANEFYGLVYPQDNILSKNLVHLLNFFAFRLWGNPFRTYIHDSKIIDGIIQSNGLRQIERKNVGFWQILIYQR